MGYCAEVCVSGPKNAENAQVPPGRSLLMRHVREITEFFLQATQHGISAPMDHLRALGRPQAYVLSRDKPDSITCSRPERTQVEQTSDAHSLRQRRRPSYSAPTRAWR
jgi:hypothetical protein